MADDSELDYLRTFLQYACPNSTIKHFSEVKKMSQIDGTSRCLIYPGELLSVDGKFYKKRYKISISDISEANIMDMFNKIVDAINDLQRGTEIKVHYTGISFDVSSEMATGPQGICWDGTYYWIVCDEAANDKVYKYNEAGVYQTVNFDVSSEDTTPRAICWDGTFFWVVGSDNDRAYKYNAAGVYQSSYIDLSGEGTAPNGITWDGTYFWTSDNVQRKLFKYTSAGVYTGDSYALDDLSNHGVVYDDYRYWTVGFNKDKVYKHEPSGTYSGESFSVATEDTSPIDIGWDGTYLCVVGGANKYVYKYNRYAYSKPSTLCHIKLAYGNLAKEEGTTKRWYQDIYIDVEWCTV